MTVRVTDEWTYRGLRALVLSNDELRAAGVGPGTVRLSVGTESVDDLIWDLEQGFALVAATAAKPAGLGQQERGSS